MLLESDNVNDSRWQGSKKLALETNMYDYNFYILA